MLAYKFAFKNYTEDYFFEYNLSDVIDFLKGKPIYKYFLIQFHFLEDGDYINPEFMNEHFRYL